MTVHEMKWNEMKWNEMKWNEMKWNDCAWKWNEMIGQYSGNNMAETQKMTLYEN